MVQMFSKNLFRNIFWLTVFGIAMGFLEAIVVIYLRDIYYPQGFGFPLGPVAPKMYYVELIREFSTLLMLIALASLAGKTGIQKLAYFLISFAIWDIFYYVALKLFLDWPSSLLTWDVLFLIPLPWLGPVIAPVIVSLTMIWIGDWEPQISLKTGEILLMLLGAAAIFVGFIWNYSALIVTGGYLSNFWTLTQNEDFLKIIYDYAPVKFNWPIFISGEIMVLAAAVNFQIRYQQFFRTKSSDLQNLFRGIRQQLFKSI
jgi:hypothetical protein